MKPLILVFSFFACFFEPSKPEAPAVRKLHYIITQKGKQIGDVYAVRTIHDEHITYDVETHMVIKLLVTQKVDYTSTAEYRDGILISSHSKSYVNGKLHNTCVTSWKGGRYEIKKDNEISQLSREVPYSGVMLYFKEPGNNNLVYSEMSGHDNAMRKTGDGTYTLTDLKTRKENRYRYQGGILDHAFLNHVLIDIELQRVN